ncbi:MAG: class I tRNA ligase family protein [Thermodesulfovibrionales bacterium]
MLRLFNTFGRKIGSFHPARKDLVTIFTCGPSVYQRAHIGNFRTFLFEDILVRYLEYSGYKVSRGLIFTDIEDKAVLEADKKHASVEQLTEKNFREFLDEMELLRMKTPDYMPKASESINQAVEIIEELLGRKIAYWHKGNVYFDPLKFPGFGKLYGLDMSKWPKKKVRFHKDTYPGTQWNLGDFILWHGHKRCDKACWNTSIGRGRPSWNIQDPAMVSRYFNETLSIYCGGIDNLYRHHDYTLAILESVRPYPMARFWLHCNHLYVEGRKMSKSRGNIYYTDMLLRDGYSMQEVRFFLIYEHYRKDLDFSKKNMEAAIRGLKEFKGFVRAIKRRASALAPKDSAASGRILKLFSECMDNDLNVKEAFDGIYKIVAEIDIHSLKQSEASGIIRALKKIDEVLQVIF